LNVGYLAFSVTPRLEALTEQVERSNAQRKAADKDRQEKEEIERKVRDAAHQKVLAEQGMLIERGERLNRLSVELERKLDQLNRGPP